jgi:hypothetical protein
VPAVFCSSGSCYRSRVMRPCRGRLAGPTRELAFNAGQRVKIECRRSHVRSGPTPPQFHFGCTHANAPRGTSPKSPEIETPLGVQPRPGASRTGFVDQPVLAQCSGILNSIACDGLCQSPTIADGSGVLRLPALTVATELTSRRCRSARPLTLARHPDHRRS